MLTRSQMALLCLGLFLALALCGAWQAFAWGRTQLDTGALVCADTLRLHIRPEKDSIASQRGLSHVRVAVLADQDAARHALAGLNIRAPVRVQLGNMYFDTRRYASGILPAGRYDALRIQIGAGNGRNWWCVLYPGLCRSACGGYARPAENDLVCGNYILRLRLVEWVQQHTARREGVVLLG